MLDRKSDPVVSGQRLFWGCDRWTEVSDEDYEENEATL